MKYRFDGKTYRYGVHDEHAFKFIILDVVNKYLNEHPNMSYTDIKRKFNHLHSSQLIRNENSYNKWLADGNNNTTKRYFDEPISYNHDKYYVLNQFGHDKNYDRLGTFIQFANNKLSYNIEKIINNTPSPLQTTTHTVKDRRIQNIILYGVPGVGKTYNTNNLINMLEQQEKSEQTNKQLLKLLTQTHSFSRITLLLHPNYN